LPRPGLAARAGRAEGQGQALVIYPLTLVRIADMDFATLGVTTGGTATIDPVSGT
jgi:hypothetical protein